MVHIKPITINAACYYSTEGHQTDVDKNNWASLLISAILASIQWFPVTNTFHVLLSQGNILTFLTVQGVLTIVRSST